jgi:hypothetical protein
MKLFPFSNWQENTFPFLSAIVDESLIPALPPPIDTAFLDSLAAANPVQVYPTVQGTYLAGQSVDATSISVFAVAVSLGQSWLGYLNGSSFSNVPQAYGSPANYTFNGVVYSMQVFFLGSAGIGSLGTGWLLKP